MQYKHILTLFLSALLPVTVFSQEIPPAMPAPEVISAPINPANPVNPAPVAPAIAPTEPVAPAAPAVPEAVDSTVATSIDSVTAVVAPVLVPVDSVTPVVPAVPVDSATVATVDSTVEAAPEAQEIVAAIPTIPAIAATKEKGTDFFKIGVRVGLGVSALRNHKALYSIEFGLNAIQLDPAFSAGAGITTAFAINPLLTIAPELQYTAYRANGEFAVKTEGKDFMDLNEAGVILHSFELPIMARFNFSCMYAEVGPQLGYNFYSRIYKNSKLVQPELNDFAFGPSLGFGVKMNEMLVGLRGHFGVLEYAKNSNGYPWAAQVSFTHFFSFKGE